MNTGNSTFRPGVMWSSLPLSYSGYLVPPSENIRLSGRRMFVPFFWRGLKQSPDWGPWWKASWCHTPLRRVWRNLICCEIQMNFLNVYLNRFFPFVCNAILLLSWWVLVGQFRWGTQCLVVQIQLYCHNVKSHCVLWLAWLRCCSYESPEFSNLLAKFLVLATCFFSDNLGHLDIFKADVILCLFMMTAEDIKRVYVCVLHLPWERDWRTYKSLI